MTRAGSAGLVQRRARGFPARFDPLRQECVNKAKALFRAAEEARRFAGAAQRGQ
jgi:anthranilate synthase component 1